MKLLCLIPIIHLSLALPSLTPSFGAPSPAPVDSRVATLNAILTSTAAQKEKADACRELARLGTKESVTPLAALLGNVELAHMARYALEQIPDPSVDEAFRKALDQLKGPALVGVIGSIGARHDLKAGKALSLLLHDQNPEVAQAAARALGSLGNSAAAAALQTELPVASLANQLSLCEGLLRCAENLAASGHRALAAEIYDRLRTNQRYTQVQAAALRGSILNRKAGLSLLTQVLHSTDYVLFSVAVHTSLEMPGGMVTAALTNELLALPPVRQILVIQMLGKRTDPRAVPVLLTACKMAPQQVRIAAIRALSEINDTSTTPALIDLLTDSSPEVAREALECLGGLQGSAVDTAILNTLDSAQPAIRLAGMELAVRRRLLSARSSLYKAAASNDSHIRTVAVKKLAELGQPADLPQFLDLLCSAQNPEDLEVIEQSAALVASKSSNPDSSAETVATYFSKTTAEQHGSLLRVLGTTGGQKALGFVVSSIQDTNAVIHAAAIRVLANWNSAEAAAPLLQIIRTSGDPTEKMICVRGYLGLASHAELSTNQRLAMCQEVASFVEKDEEKKLFLAALSSNDSPGALTLLQPYLDADSTRAEAASSCLSIAGRILEGAKNSKSASALIEPLQKIADSATNPELAAKAKRLLETAKNKSAENKN